MTAPALFAPVPRLSPEQANRNDTSLSETLKGFQDDASDSQSKNPPLTDALLSSLSAPSLSPKPRKRFPPRTHKPVKTDTALKGLKPEAKAYAVSIALDGHGLYIQVAPSGKKYWRHAFRDPATGKSSVMGYGVYPDVSLADALKKSTATRALLLKGINPAQQKRQAKARNIAAAESEKHTFREVATEWLEKINSVHAPVTCPKNRYWLEKYVYGRIGNTPVSKLQTIDFIHTLQPLEDKGIHSALKRIRNICEQVMDYAVSNQFIEFNPLYALKKVFAVPKSKHFSAITEPAKFGQMLAKLWEKGSGSVQAKAFARLMPYVFCRTTELRNMKWADIDFQKAEWKYIATKTDHASVVPLSRQALAILSEMKSCSGDNEAGLVFPSPVKLKQNIPISKYVILDSFKRAGIPKEQMTGHGFRAAAATILEETLGFDAKIINMQLAHVMKDPNGDAYRRAQFLDERRLMMQIWADAIDRLRQGDDPETVAYRAKEEKAKNQERKYLELKEKMKVVSL
jgi:integrase